MALLNDTDSAKPTRRTRSTKRGSSSVPSSLPSSELLNDIESLKAQIAELQKDKDENRQALADLKAQLEDAKNALHAKMETEPDEQNRKPGFFGY